MRKRFETQYSLGTLKIEDTKINVKSRDAFTKLIIALKYIYTDEKYNSQVLSLLDRSVLGNKQNTGRPGMNLWQIFVLAQTRLALNISYDRLHHMVNHDALLGQIIGIQTTWEYEKAEIEYQTIVDNVKLLDDETLKKINDIIVKMGHDVFKKKETEASNLKSDSFVVETNVHFPTDYNLLWDSMRKTLDAVEEFLKKYAVKGWRKIEYWRQELKNMMRAISQSSRKKEEARVLLVEEYLHKSKSFSEKLDKEQKNLPLNDTADLARHCELDYYKGLIVKHIDLLERRIINGEKIPHQEKMFSIFEPYTEWITKGKQNPSFELGKNLTITSDQFHLIVDFEIMEHQTDSQIVIPLADRVLQKYDVSSWSFDKGYYSKENKELLNLFIEKVIMPKKGRLNKQEEQEEHQKEFKKLRNKHSAVESNINELEHRGLDRCPDRGYQHFKNYVALGICAYNLHRIGAELLRQAKEKIKLKQVA